MLTHLHDECGLQNLHTQLSYKLLCSIAVVGEAGERVVSCRIILKTSYNVNFIDQTCILHHKPAYIFSFFSHGITMFPYSFFNTDVFICPGKMGAL